MSEIALTQEEIEALLRASDSGETPAPGRREGKDGPALNRLLYSATLAGSAALEAALGAKVKIDPPAVSPAPGHDGRAHLVLPVTDAGGGYLHLLISTPVAQAMLDLLCGGHGVKQDELLASQVKTVGEVLGELVRDFAAHLSAVNQRPVELTLGEPSVLEAGDYSGWLAELKPELRLVYPWLVGDSARGFMEQWYSRAMLEALAVSPGPAAPRRAAHGPVSIRPPAFEPLQAGPVRPGGTNLDLLLDVPLQVTVELGRTRRSVKEVLALGIGSVLDIEKLAGEAVEVLVNGKLVARGEVVVIDDNFGVRITDILSPQDRVKKLGE
ncbi:MAG TPA: flagellar motor switch protein FliN [Clostridiales bacterium UBA8153]|nr:flagellar motor switch protein FliN [Clostridiales bacterium UBA8153]